MKVKKKIISALSKLREDKMEIIKKFRSEVSIISNDNFLDNSGLEKNEISNTSFNGADSNDSISKSSFILSDLHSSLKDFLKSLSGEELLAFGGLLLNGLIVNYTVNIIFILYGDYLIKKFNLESRYPKLCKFIELRRKLQNYYLKISNTWIFICVLPQIYLYSIIIFSKLSEFFNIFSI